MNGAGQHVADQGGQANGKRNRGQRDGQEEITVCRQLLQEVTVPVNQNTCEIIDQIITNIVAIKIKLIGRENWINQ